MGTEPTKEVERDLIMKSAWTVSLGSLVHSAEIHRASVEYQALCWVLVVKDGKTGPLPSEFTLGDVPIDVWRVCRESI